MCKESGTKKKFAHVAPAFQWRFMTFKEVLSKLTRSIGKCGHMRVHVVWLRVCGGTGSCTSVWGLVCAPVCAPVCASVVCTSVWGLSRDRLLLLPPSQSFHENSHLAAGFGNHSLIVRWETWSALRWLTHTWRFTCKTSSLPALRFPCQGLAVVSLDIR